MPTMPKNVTFEPDPELVEILKAPKKEVCTIGQLITEHPNGDDIAKAVANQKWSAAQLAIVLRKIRPCSAQAVSAHRGQTCRCE